MSEELMRCPFCGEQKLELGLVFSIGETPYFAVECTWCAARGPIWTELEKALVAWNSRKVPNGENL